MLIIDMPMPKYCADCPMIALSDRGMICLCTEALLEIDYDKKRPSWCPIKGELVLCGECKYFIENTWECVRLSDRFGDEYSDARVYPEYYCADGERRTE